MEIIEKIKKKLYKKPTMERVTMFSPREAILSMGKDPYRNEECPCKCEKPR